MVYVAVRCDSNSMCTVGGGKKCGVRPWRHTRQRRRGRILVIHPSAIIRIITETLQTPSAALTCSSKNHRQACSQLSLTSEGWLPPELNPEALWRRSSMNFRRHAPMAVMPSNVLSQLGEMWTSQPSRRTWTTQPVK